jgi:phage/plasmid-like protein (TIGR03299 family)
MAHELEIDREGRASFCYNEANGNPWHRLGNGFMGGFTLDEALMAANVRTASKAALYAMTPGGMMEVDSHCAIVWPSVDDPDSWDVLGVNGIDYHMVQYELVAELAIGVVGASSGDAVLDTMGLMFNGKRFFGFIDFGGVQIVLPNGAYDLHYKGLAFLTSHDASQAVTFFKTNTRAVCNNTVTAGLNRSKHVVRIRHTEAADEQLGQVRELLDLSYGGDQDFTAMVNMLGMAQGGDDVLSKVIEKIWPQPKHEDATDRAKTIWSNRSEKIHNLYLAPSNSGGFGHNGWAVYNTVSEFLDHRLGGNLDRRAWNAIDPSSSTSARKDVAIRTLVGAL